MIKHLQETNMSYFGHFRRAAGLSIQLLLFSFFAMVHAICPFVYQQTTGKLLSKLNQRYNSNKWI